MKISSDDHHSQKDAPLFQALKRFSSQQPISFHVPGHKNGNVFPDIGRGYFKELLPIDVTELQGLDDLHQPEGIIADAMTLLKDFYNTHKSYFLVNGTTVGNLAMIMALCEHGSQVLVQRDSHKSIFQALKLANLDPVFMPPIVDKDLDLPTGVDSDQAIQWIQDYPDAQAIILTTPNYFGFSRDYTKLFTYARQAGLYILVDEAHGAHYKASSALPLSALDMGADVVVQSAHKTLPAMTMGSYLHINSTNIPVGNIETYLSMLQSSSPSYPIMASLDLARYYVANITDNEISEMLNNIELFKQRLNSIKNIQLLGVSDTVIATDPLKVLMSYQGCSGTHLQKVLESYHIYTEMAGEDYVVLVFPLSPFNSDQVMASIQSACDDIKQNHALYQSQYQEKMDDKPRRLALSYHSQEQTTTHLVSLDDAVGQIAAETIIPYPPGVPMVLQGERISQTTIFKINQLIQQNRYFQDNKNIAHGVINVYNMDYKGE
ncbi:aminotransferase class I/II-fold pyridoxal phosphate-dependent enzyme [Tuberibacillus sp. Marseille-P3662]|uniref:aminotransferase class I/II-fold pyridoxal phosphate-dependent enzyme n=1 Tax=Tuberibacillus sp. Marseille-P3662 TaxID=1965358 RepID=UPI000A1CE3E1|nr:aminotransferase class I/II-fold pyridoxal phosphate-dependent enzyme [Tuberibacillus sp. Marseille-P3662]